MSNFRLKSHKIIAFGGSDKIEIVALGEVRTQPVRNKTRIQVVNLWYGITRPWQNALLFLLL